MRITTNDGRPAPQRRRGALMAAELLFTMPVLMLFLMGVVEYYLLVTTRIDMLHACRAGSRVAASGSYAYKAQTEDEVKKTVQASLGNGRLERFSEINVVWSQDLPPQETAGQAAWVEVVVKVPPRRVIPDFLGWVGFTVGSKKLVTSVLMKQE
jgi:hypothetical protein